MFSQLKKASPAGYNARSSRGQSSLVWIESPDRCIDRGLSDLVICATRAVFTLMMQRAIALPDHELMILIRTLRTCGMIADETGNLLPMLFFQMHRETLIENDDPEQFARLRSVLDFPDVNTCIPGRSICGDALRSLAELVKAGACESVVIMRELLTGQIDQRVYQRLIKECDSFQGVVQQREKTARVPPPGDPWWLYQYYIPIAVFKSLGHVAARSAKKQSTRRVWWWFW
jgi:hypothetical protein